MNALFESKRLYFRPFSLIDAQDLLHLNSDPEVIKYTGDDPFGSIEKARDFIVNYDHYDKHGFGRWAVIRKKDDRFIGWCGLKFNEEDEIDLGFRFFKRDWGKGYASEAAQATIDFGIEHLKMTRFVGRSAQENIASIKVLEKLGFVFQSKRECHGIADAYYFVLNI